MEAACKGANMSSFRSVPSYIVLIASLALAPAAQATNRECRIKPTMVITDRNGNVMISGKVVSGATGNWNWQNICSVNGALGGVSVDVCRNWVSSALTAQASSKVIYMIYNDTENNGIADCANFPAWNQPRIDYFGPEG